MLKINSNVAKAASAIFTSSVLDGMTFLHTGDDSFWFEVWSSELGECTLSVAGAPSSVIIEVSVARKHHCFGHPNSKFSLYILDGESNDTYVNATRLALASLEKQVLQLEKNLPRAHEEIFVETSTYEFDKNNEIKDTPAKLLAHNLEHPLPKDWVVDSYKRTKDPDDSKSIDKYVNVDLGDVDMNRASSVKCFLEDLCIEYEDTDPVNKMMLKSLRDAINWVLKESGSEQKVDSKTVLVALMVMSLNSKHDVFEEREKIADDMPVMVPDAIFDLVILYRDNRKK